MGGLIEIAQKTADAKCNKSAPRNEHKLFAKSYNDIPAERSHDSFIG